MDTDADDPSHSEVSQDHKDKVALRTTILLLGCPQLQHRKCLGSRQLDFAFAVLEQSLVVNISLLEPKNEG